MSLVIFCAVAHGSEMAPRTKVSSTVRIKDPPTFIVGRLARPAVALGVKDEKTGKEVVVIDHIERAPTPTSRLHALS